MNPGSLRHMVSIERPITLQNEYGEMTVTVWEPIEEVYASREDLQGRELFYAQQLAAEMTTRFTIRYRDGLDETMRIVGDDGREYNILSIADTDGKRRTLTILTARQGTNG